MDVRGLAPTSHNTDIPMLKLARSFGPSGISRLELENPGGPEADGYDNSLLLLASKESFPVGMPCQVLRAICIAVDNTGVRGAREVQSSHQEIGDPANTRSEVPSWPVVPTISVGTSAPVRREPGG